MFSIITIIILNMNICIDGISGSGRSTVVRFLQHKYPNRKINNANMKLCPSALKDVYDVFQPEKLDPDTIYIVLDADAHECIERTRDRDYSGREYKVLHRELFKYRNRYIRLAIKYQLYFIDSTKQTIEGIVEAIEYIIKNHDNDWKSNPNDRSKYILPNPNLVDVDKLPVIVEGCSKIVRSYDDKFNIIEYKPTVYSHKQQREGVIEGTNFERMRMTRDILYLLEKHAIPHAYVFVGDKYVLCKKLDPAVDIPNVEVIVKNCHIGTDPYRYYKMSEMKTRYGSQLVAERNKYPEPVVRFDFRNPNRHPEKFTPMGDEAMCDDLANYLINVTRAKELARETFKVLEKYFNKMNVFFEDVCFMITTDGYMHWSEISQDCGRYKLMDDNGYTALDKDVWRAGGSSELVTQKWSQMSGIVNKYVRENY